VDYALDVDSLRENGNGLTVLLNLTGPPYNEIGRLPVILYLTIQVTYEPASR
jgi:hypothetical protein